MTYAEYVEELIEMERRRKAALLLSGGYNHPFMMNNQEEAYNPFIFGCPGEEKASCVDLYVENVEEETGTLKR